MAKKPETIFKEKVQADLKALGDVYFVKIQQVAIRGTPDILACIRGLFVALELKATSSDKPSERQIYELNKIKKAGGVALTVCPESWPGVYEFLSDLAPIRQPAALSGADPRKIFR